MISIGPRWVGITSLKYLLTPAFFHQGVLHLAETNFFLHVDCHILAAICFVTFPEATISTYYGLRCESSQNSYVRVLTLVPQNVTIFRDRVLKEIIKVK